MRSATGKRRARQRRHHDFLNEHLTLCRSCGLPKEKCSDECWRLQIAENLKRKEESASLRARARAMQAEADAQDAETRRKEFIDKAVEMLANYQWTWFITLTFREHMGGEEMLERETKKFMAWLHERCFGDLSDVRDLFGIRYFMAIQRGTNGTHRLHVHLLVAGGARLSNARWEEWSKHWNKLHGYIRIERPRSQPDVAAYCARYITREPESGFDLRSTWADAEERRAEKEAPLFKPFKHGVEVTVSAALPHPSYRSGDSFLTTKFNPPPQQGLNLVVSSLSPGCAHAESVRSGLCAERLRRAGQLPFDLRVLSRRERRRARGHSRNALHTFVSQRGASTAAAN
jgi:hypothetical protein